MSVADWVPAVMRSGVAHCDAATTDEQLIELVHLVHDALRAHRDHRTRGPADPVHGRLPDLARPTDALARMLHELLVHRDVAWQRVARHAGANRPWELIELISDRTARAEAYRLEVHYHEQVAATLRRQRGAWLGAELGRDNELTKIALSAEMGVSRPTLDKWLSSSAQ